MTDDNPDPAVIDIGEYCRRVEDHLTRVNAGHLVRIVGPGFEVVRSWANDGVPLSVVYRGIERKAERHRLGRSTRPLRIEFCEGDVRSIFDDWRRAIGVMPSAAPDGSDPPDDATGGGDSSPDEGPTAEEAIAAGRKPSLSRHLDRSVTRLTRAAGRVDLPEAFRDRVTTLLEELTALRESARRARGAAREALEPSVARVHADLMDAARTAAPPDLLAALARDARDELAQYRTRLPGPSWERAVAVTTDRLLRERWDLPEWTS